MKQQIKKAINKLGYDFTKITNQNSEGASNLDEDRLINKYVKLDRHIVKYCVDIGASDGKTMSNSWKLFNNGWQGLAVECDKSKFEILAGVLKNYDVRLSNSFVTPENVLDLFRAAGVPKIFGLLSIDIDGYDFFVIKEILNNYQPQIIVAEINEKIPPPIKFTVTYDKKYFWDNSHFYGQSLSMLHSLCSKEGYKLAELHYNNVFYVKSNSIKGLDPTEAYHKGYFDRQDRKDKFPWNADVEEVYSLRLDDQIKYFKNKFKKYKNFKISK